MSTAVSSDFFKESSLATKNIENSRCLLLDDYKTQVDSKPDLKQMLSKQLLSKGPKFVTLKNKIQDVILRKSGQQQLERAHWSNYRNSTENLLKQKDILPASTRSINSKKDMLMMTGSKTLQSLNLKAMANATSPQPARIFSSDQKNGFH